MHTFYCNYYVYLCVYIVMGDYLCVFMCIYNNGRLFMLIFNKCVKLRSYIFTVCLMCAKTLIST